MWIICRPHPGEGRGGKGVWGGGEGGLEGKAGVGGRRGVEMGKGVCGSFVDHTRVREGGEGGVGWRGGGAGGESWGGGEERGGDG